MPALAKVELAIGNDRRRKAFLQEAVVRELPDHLPCVAIKAEYSSPVGRRMSHGHVHPVLVHRRHRYDHPTARHFKGPTSCHSIRCGLRSSFDINLASPPHRQSVPPSGRIAMTNPGPAYPPHHEPRKGGHCHMTSSRSVLFTLSTVMNASHWRKRTKTPPKMVGKSSARIARGAPMPSVG